MGWFRETSGSVVEIKVHNPPYVNS